MRINFIEWDEGSVFHIARHGVDTNEVEESFFEGDPSVFKSRYNRYYALGQTRGGRCLTIIFEYLGQNKARVITARAMSKSERRLYKRGR